MTKSMEQAIAEIAAMPEAQQEWWGTHILAELADEREWDRQFAETTPEQWARIEAMARAEIEAGDLQPLDPDKM